MKVRTCDRGHLYTKTSDCPVCPVCERSKDIPAIFKNLSAPARRALATAGIETAVQLSKHSLDEILRLHGIGKASVPALMKILESNRLHFKTSAQH